MYRVLPAVSEQKSERASEQDWFWIAAYSSVQATKLTDIQGNIHIDTRVMRLKMTNLRPFDVLGGLQIAVGISRSCR